MPVSFISDHVIPYIFSVYKYSLCLLGQTVHLIYHNDMKNAWDFSLDFSIIVYYIIYSSAILFYLHRAQIYTDNFIKNCNIALQNIAILVYMKKC